MVQCFWIDDVAVQVRVAKACSFIEIVLDDSVKVNLGTGVTLGRDCARSWKVEFVQHFRPKTLA